MKTTNSKSVNGVAALGVAVAVMVALSMAFPHSVGSGQAQSSGQQPSAKATAKVSHRTLIPETTGTGDWVTILCNNIKTPNWKDLFITAALEAGLRTRTLAPPDSEAEAFIEVRVLRDGLEVEPGVIAYGRREQELKVTDATVQLELDTLEAASFSFVDEDVPVGVHQICVQARIRTEGHGNFSAFGAVGKGTMTVEEVRMIKGEDVVLAP
jgi:hypothetical protein